MDVCLWLIYSAGRHYLDMLVCVSMRIRLRHAHRVSCRSPEEWQSRRCEVPWLYSRGCIQWTQSFSSRRSAQPNNLLREGRAGEHISEQISGLVPRIQPGKPLNSLVLESGNSSSSLVAQRQRSTPSALPIANCRACDCTQVGWGIVIVGIVAGSRRLGSVNLPLVL